MDNVHGVHSKHPLNSDYEVLASVMTHRRCSQWFGHCTSAAFGLWLWTVAVSSLYFLKIDGRRNVIALLAVAEVMTMALGFWRGEMRSRTSSHQRTYERRKRTSFCPRPPSFSRHTFQISVADSSNPSTIRRRLELSKRQRHKLSRLVYKLLRMSPRANYTDRRLSAKLVPTFADRGASRGQRRGSLPPYSRFSRPGAATFSSKLFLSCTHEAEWTPFQTHYFSENLVAPGIEPGPLDL
jgi:hypothetical protein